MKNTPLETPAKRSSSLLRKLPINPTTLLRLDFSVVRRVRAMGKAYVMG